MSFLHLATLYTSNKDAKIAGDGSIKPQNPGRGLLFPSNISRLPAPSPSVVSLAPQSGTTTTPPSSQGMIATNTGGGWEYLGV